MATTAAWKLEQKVQQNRSASMISHLRWYYGMAQRAGIILKLSYMFYSKSKSDGRTKAWENTTINRIELINSADTISKTIAYRWAECCRGSRAIYRSVPPRCLTLWYRRWRQRQTETTRCCSPPRGRCRTSRCVRWTRCLLRRPEDSRWPSIWNSQSLKRMNGNRK